MPGWREILTPIDDHPLSGIDGLLLWNIRVAAPVPASLQCPLSN